MPYLKGPQLLRPTKDTMWDYSPSAVISSTFSDGNLKLNYFKCKICQFKNSDIESFKALFTENNHNTVIPVGYIWPTGYVFTIYDS